MNRRRLRWEDLEDCYSQATLELVTRARRDPFTSQEHIVHALEQKFSSRIDDRRRAIGGRSPIEMAIARAVPVDAPDSGAAELEDPSAEVLRQVAGRIELRRLQEVATELTEDQRLVLACQVSLGMDCGEFCRRYGWSPEKFRKVAQRARARLRSLVSEYRVGDRCSRLEPDIIAYAAGAATEEQTHRTAAHIANCTACASQLRSLDRPPRQIAAVLPAPVAANVGLIAKLGGLILAGRRMTGLLGRGTTEAGAAGVAGGSAVGAGAVKLGVAAACLAGAAGGYAICGPGIGTPVSRVHHHVRAAVRHQARPAESTTPIVVTRTPAPSRSAGTAPPPIASGAVASAVAHREFGTSSARAAAVITPSASEPAQSAAAIRSSGQAQREFSGFER
ncbi:MAG: hypothetical protein ACR2KV_09960 [Solirubrobacteraceae bacterium]